eukprot:TRINITY_DN61154_c0_g1_i1.p1 TRINITY_DN61154_c0_g1~~TRINITY_DN61154_c0_g1_i1.p1  ORF type:complete len:452 (+),score=89.56 TRINITY_DN61154_c0_g1_i1:70-1356(+)
MPDKDADEEVLLYSGLSRCLTQLEEDLVKWHSEERSIVSEAQTDLATAEQELAAMEAAIREATPDMPQDDSWQSRLSSLLQTGKEQRDELEELCSLMRRHAPRVEASGSFDLQQLPEAGQPIKLASNSLARLFSSFLTSIEQAAQQSLDDDGKADDGEGRSEVPATKEKLEPEAEQQGRRPRRRRPAGGREKQEAAMEDPRSQPPLAEGRPRKRRRIAKDRAPPGQMRGGDRDNEFSEAYSCDDVYSESRTPSPRPQIRRRRRTARRRPDHGYPRSASYTPSCERRPRRRPPYPPGGGERRRTHHQSAGPPPGSGGGRRRTQEDFGGDVDVALDRFIRVNRLEGRCEKDLRALSAKTAWQVMGCMPGAVGHTFELSGDIRDPVAVVMGRIRKAQSESGGGRPPSGRGPREGRQGAGARRRSSRSRSRH